MKAYTQITCAKCTRIGGLRPYGKSRKMLCRVHFKEAECAEARRAEQWAAQFEGSYHPAEKCEWCRKWGTDVRYVREEMICSRCLEKFTAYQAQCAKEEATQDAVRWPSPRPDFKVVGPPVQHDQRPWRIPWMQHVRLTPVDCVINPRSRPWP